VPFSNAGYEFKALFNNVAIGIIVTNDHGEIIMINDFALSQFHYEEEELIGKKIEILIPQRYRERHIDHRERYGTNAHSRPMGLGMDLFAVKKEGTEFPVEVSLSPYSRGTRQFAVVFISDISVRKESEMALLQLNAELEEKVKERTQSLTDALSKEKELNELKSRFVSMASHEFRTPLSTILSSAYLVTKYEATEDQPKREKHIQRIVSSVNMLNDILNDFLSVGRIEEGRMQVRFSDVKIEETIRAQINEMHTILKRGQKIYYTHSGKEQAWLDMTLLKHILMNLVSNAIKFSPESSQIIISTEYIDDSLTLSVKDAGVGISKADQEHLFERFFRGSNVTNVQGTGLGLHIVAKYAELMNGEIICKSDVNMGTEFIINFKPSNIE